MNGRHRPASARHHAARRAVRLPSRFGSGEALRTWGTLTVIVGGFVAVLTTWGLPLIGLGAAAALAGCLPPS